MSAFKIILAALFWSFKILRVFCLEQIILCGGIFEYVPYLKND